MNAQKNIENSSQQKPAGASTLNTISPFLKEADKFVKSGNLQKALEVVQQAHQAAPGNLYVLAYESNVQSLIEKSKSANKQRPADKTVAAGKIEKLAQVTLEEVDRTEQLAQTLIQTRTELQQEYSEQQKKSKMQEEVMKRRISQFLALARKLAEDKKFSMALDEINRAFLIDPFNEEINILEKEIRVKYDDENIRLQKEQQLLQDEEEQLLKEVETTGKTATITVNPDVVAKVEALLTEAKKVAQVGEYEKAMSFILEASSLHPTHSGVIQLHKRVTEALDIRKRELEEIERQKFIARKNAAQAKNIKIEKLLLTAQQSITNQQFAEVVKILDEVEKLNPHNKDAQRLRSVLHTAQLQVLDAIQSQTALPENTIRKKQLESIAQASAQQTTTEPPFDNAIPLQRAQAYFKQCRYEDALGEIAVILSRDPEHEVALGLRHEIITMQQKLHSSLQEQISQIKEQQKKQREKEEMLQSIMQNIQTLRDKKLFSDALDEISKAISLDPLNEILAKQEVEIRNEQNMSSVMTEDSTIMQSKHRSLDTLRNAKEILMQSGYLKSQENVPTEVALRSLGKELKKNLGKIKK